MMQSSNWIPEILYEDSDDGLTSKIPFIQVPENEEMPNILFIFESRETGEFEPGLDGEEVPVAEIELHQYASMATLKNKLSWMEYDNVRFALGLEPLKDAAIKGHTITSNIRVALNPDGSGNALANAKGENQAQQHDLTADGFKANSKNED
jgi:hypothetical protein